MTNILSKRMVIAMAALLGVMGLIALHPGNGFAATQANGACGGGNGSSINLMINGWNAHGVLDDVAAQTGQTPGLDGDAATIVRHGLVKVIVVNGGWVQNFTCQNGSFIKLTGAHAMKYIPAGSPYWVPARIAPKTGMSKVVSAGWQDNCGNLQKGHLMVRRPGTTPAKHKKVAKQVSIKVTTIPCAGKLIQVGVNQFVCEIQTNNNSSSQSGQTSGQGSPVINVNQTTQVNVNQNQNQGQSQQQSSSPPATCPAGTTGTPPNCVTPPVSKPAPSCSFNTVQELDESNFSVSPQITSTAPVYLHCTAPSGDSLSITQRAGTGTLSSNSASSTATGSDQVTSVTYTAPTEPGTDTVSAHVVDNTTGESTDVTVSIKIVAPQPSP